MKEKVLAAVSLISIVIVAPTFCYDVALKNGKVVHGTVVREDDQMIVIKDETGVQLTLKKANIDAEKTASMNVPQPAPSQPAKAATPAAAQHKPVRKITQEDLIKLRQKYELNEGLTNESTSADSTSEVSYDIPKTEKEWSDESQRLQAEMKKAEKDYQYLKKECEDLKALTIQGYILEDEETKDVLSIPNTRKKVCENADEAKKALADARQRLQDFLDEARRNSVLPGTIRNADGTDPEVSKDKPEKKPNQDGIEIVIPDRPEDDPNTVIPQQEDPH